MTEDDGSDRETVDPEMEMLADYDRCALLWQSGPELIYRTFADAFVHAVPIPLAGTQMLDLGAGTGAVTTSLRAAGSLPTAVDASASMLRSLRRSAGIRVAAADALRLPFPNAVFDGSLAGFLLNHMREPHLALAEWARVTRRGGVVMAMTFAAGDNHPVKDVVNQVASRWGWKAPAWYEEQKCWATQTDTPEGLLNEAAIADVGSPDVSTIVVDAGSFTVRELLAWRLGHAHMARFAVELSVEELQDLINEAETALGRAPQSLRRELLILSIQVPA